MKIPNKKNIEKGVLTIAFAIIFYSLLIFYGDLKNLLEHIDRLKINQIALIISFTIISLLFRFLRWKSYLKLQKIDLRLQESVEYYLAGFSMIITPGKLGESIKCYLMNKKSNIPISKSLGIVISERVSDLYSLTIIALISYSLIFLGELYAITLTTLTLASTYVILRNRNYLVNRLIDSQLPVFQKLSDNLEHMEEQLKRQKTLLNPRNQIVPLFYSLISWTINAAALFILVNSIGDITITETMLSFSSSSIAGAMSMIPGGLGVVEGGMAGALQVFGISKSGAVASTIILRILSFWFTFIIGATILAYHLYRYRG